MKIRTIITVSLLALTSPFLAQSGAELPVNREIGISGQQTTSLLFPYPIASVDRGSQDILAQKPTGIENILQIKAAQEEFMPSNLTVITTDGKLYNFHVCYQEQPNSYAYDFASAERTGTASFSAAVNEDAVDRLAAAAYHDSYRIGVEESDYGITLSLTGLFVEGDHFYYRMRVENSTSISYDIDQLRFFVRDQKRSRRTASQEVELLPIKFWQFPGKIQSKAATSFVVVLPKFTIPDQKNLYIQMTERSGGRHLQLRIRNKRAEDVRLLPTFKD